MTCYDGETLKKKIERGPLPIDEAVDIARQIAAGLAKAHRLGIVHRDIKPANIMIRPDDGIVKILDFGLAKLAGAAGLTRAGFCLGTPAYMSPEQARGEGVDHRTDLWAVGVCSTRCSRAGRRSRRFHGRLVYVIQSAEAGAPRLASSRGAVGARGAGARSPEKEPAPAATTTPGTSAPDAPGICSRRRTDGSAGLFAYRRAPARPGGVRRHGMAGGVRRSESGGCHRQPGGPRPGAPGGGRVVALRWRDVRPRA